MPPGTEARIVWQVHAAWLCFVAHFQESACLHMWMHRWQSITPRSGPSGNPAVVMAQLEDAARQLEDVKEEADQLCKVRLHA